LFCWSIERKVEAHYKGAKIVVTLYYFLRVPCLNFNHVIILKDLHNVFSYYGKSKPKKIKCYKTTVSYFIWCHVRIYFCQKKCQNILKNWLKWFLILMKFLISIKYCDSIWLE
jgi:hypothetical protein